MNKYLFETTATMKPHNAKKWWIDSGIVRPATIAADDIESAIKRYQETVKERDYIEISNNAIKNKQPMYIDTKNGDARQIGYVLTAGTYFDNDRREWVMQYIDLWVKISIIINPFGEVI